MQVPLDESLVQRCVSEESTCSQGSNSSSTSSHSPVSTWMDRFSAEYMSAISRCLEMWPDSDYFSAENRLFHNLTRVTESTNSKSMEISKVGDLSMKSNDEAGTHGNSQSKKNSEIMEENSDVKEEKDWRSAVDKSRIENCLRHSDAARALRFQRMIESFIQAHSHSAKGSLVSSAVNDADSSSTTESDTRQWMKLMVQKLSTMFIPSPSPTPIPSMPVGMPNVPDFNACSDQNNPSLPTLELIGSNTVIPKSILTDANLIHKIAVKLREMDQQLGLDMTQSSDFVLNAVSELRDSLKACYENPQSKSNSNLVVKIDPLKKGLIKTMMNRSPSLGSADSAEDSGGGSKNQRGKKNVRSRREICSDSVSSLSGSAIIPSVSSPRQSDSDFVTNSIGGRGSRGLKQQTVSATDVFYIKRAKIVKENRKRSHPKLSKKEMIAKARSRSRSDGKSVGSHSSMNGLPLKRALRPICRRKRKASAMNDDSSNNSSNGGIYDDTNHSYSMIDHDLVNSASSISMNSVSKRRRQNDDILPASVDSTHQSQSQRHRRRF